MLVLLGLPAWGGIIVQTSPEVIELNATNALTGEIELIIEGDVFADASEESPVFIRVALRDEVVLSETLVDVDGDPIYLAMTTFGNGPGFELQMNASPTAMAIVRHIAGESAFWIRVNESSSCWINASGNKVGPSPERPVIVRFGNGQLVSHHLMFPLYQLGWANLPSNTRDPDASGNPQSAEDTFVRVDISESPLIKGGVIVAEFTGFANATGVTTEPNPDNIATGPDLPIFLFPEASLGTIFPRNVFPYDFLVGGFPRFISETSACELVGSLNVAMSEYAFQEASEQDPVYLRIQLSSNARLCETLVDPRVPEPSLIYLALKLTEEVGPNQIVAPQDAAAIIRWIEGEEAIWVRITSPTNTWVSPTEGPGGPPRFIEFSLGQSGSESLAVNQVAHQTGFANLPANTRDLDTESPADSSLKVDLSSGGVSPLAPEFGAHVRTFVESTGVETSQTAVQIESGTALGLEGGSLLAILTGGQLPWEGLVLNTIPQEVEPGGSCETAGSLSMTVAGSLFEQATPELPTYIKFALPSDTTLCETLVGPTNHDPIHLSLSLENQDSQAQVVAPVDTVSIVRWVEGESAIWLRIKHPTIAWLEAKNQAMPPTPDDRVIFTMGINGQDSRTLNEALYSVDRANLPANMRESQLSNLDLSASTLIKLDISQAAMVPDPEPTASWRAFVSVDPSAFFLAFNIETATDLSDIETVGPLGISFPGSRELAFTTELVIDPPMANQGVQVVTMEARPATDVNPVDYKWVNADTNEIISIAPSIIFDPIPTDSVRVRLEVRDPQGRISLAEGTLNVNPDVFDLNNDGKNDILDLLFALPDWGASHDILFLISIPLE